MGLSQADLARITGEPRAKISAYANGERFPQADTAIAIADALGVSVPYLILGRGDGPRSLSRMNDIPLSELRFSAGHGWVDVGEIEGRVIGFSDDELRALGRTSIHGLKAFRAKGDSMTPTIPDGAPVLVDELDTQLNEGIYAFRVGEHLRIKRLRPVGVGGIEARSDNDHYPPEVFQGADLEHFKILGRVIWAGVQF
ncbi:HTH-type transcriptional regulator prtR [Asticcacaulis biprosthecium C19]|uniref:HTH-type transcriptional regulator prtR n=2 Tax=Asticcacaulis biprosthecium TaxID=76891 RepID=F4QGD3_9CAUL|nr:LexA family transcriptional regulator [Asticcacaulis biprosthecium]EGF92461.1 HTH-type transcriptional regulator prtR [Asticcacaulis biprosthecium C19]